MSSSWSALHARLLRSANRASSDYARLRYRYSNLAPFTGPEALLGHLHVRSGDPEAKNAILRSLVEEAGRDAAPGLPVELILLGLWPGLDAVRGRLLRFARADIAWLDTELLGRLSLAARTCDLDRVTRIAATLLRNVERDLKRDLRREVDLDRLGGPIEGDGIIDNRSICDAEWIDSFSDRFGRDAPLVFGVAFLRMSQKEAGAALGLGHDQARKRYRRAIDRFRSRMSQFGVQTGFSPSTAPMRRNGRRAR